MGWLFTMIQKNVGEEGLEQNIRNLYLESLSLRFKTKWECGVDNCISNWISEKRSRLEVHT